MPRNDTAVRTSRLLVMASVALVLAGLYLAQEVLVPLALAILLSFLLTPLVQMFERWRFPRGLAVAVTVAIAFGILGGIG